MTPEFYDELVKYRNKFSMTMTQTITVLIRKGLNAIAESHAAKEAAATELPQWQPKKNAPPKEIVVEERSGRKIIKNEFVDE